MANLNPYEPPHANSIATPFWTRLRKSLGRAYREYRAGLVRENMSSSEHLRTWLSVILLATITLFICGLFVVRGLIYFKIFF